MGGKRTSRVLPVSGILPAMRGSLLSVTIIVFAVAVSSASAASKCIPTLPAWVSPFEKAGLQPDPAVVSLRGRELRWNGKKIDEKRLFAYLRIAAKLNPVPSVVLKSDYRDCAFAHHVERLLRTAYPCRGDFCSQVTIR
jgi:hypothetical protein